MNNTTTFKISWDALSRLFIGALFIFAGVGKIMSFAGTTGYIDSVLHTGSLTPVITAITVFIEIVVAAVYVWGKYKKDWCGYILIAFTALATVFFHSDFNNQLNVIMTLKNLAIIGGIFATLDAVHKRRVGNHQGHSH